ncbi:MAG: tRNA-dihydrouridine synthase family protein [Planctomycetes bacterium]|nr:tRNA-dihydrouridine synthase family protein [Planctomycetota bacterium]
MRHPLPFTAPALLAPMEGVTEPCFRELVLARNPPTHLGGTFTEFVRVVDHPVPKTVLRRHLGARGELATRAARRNDETTAAVGLQLMGSDLVAVEATAAHAAELGVALLDLNFGCPARGATSTCAGSALLRTPQRVAELVRTAVRGVQDRLPVTAKIRAGYDDDANLEQLARAAEDGGASLLTVHCRTRAEGYRSDAVDWSRIERAVRAVSIPVCGNGGVESHADIERMRMRTGAAFAMIGRGALRDPWIFCGREVDFDTARAFLAEYFDTLVTRGSFAPAGALARSKQLVHYFRAGGVVESLGGPKAWLAETDPTRFRARLAVAPSPVRDETAGVGK